MEKIENTIKEKENQPAPPPTACKRCGNQAAPKFIALLGWRQQDHCDSLRDYRRRKSKARNRTRRKDDHRNISCPIRLDARTIGTNDP